MELMKKWTNPLSVGDAAEDPRVTLCIEEMVATLALILQGQFTDDRHPLLLGHLPNWHKPVDAIVFLEG